MAGDRETLELEIKVIKQEEARRSLEQTRAAVAGMSSEANRGLSSSATAAQGFAGSSRLMYTELNSVREIMGRLLGTIANLASMWNELITRNAAVARAEREVADEMGHMADEFADGFAEATNLVEVMESLDDILEDVGGTARTVGAAVGSAFQTIATQAVNLGAQAIPQLGTVLNLVLDIRRAVGGEVEGEGDTAGHRALLAALAGDPNAGPVRLEMAGDEEYLAGLEFEGGRQAQIAAARQRAAAARRATAEAGVISSVKGAQGGGGGGGDWRMTKEAEIQAEFERRIAEEYERQSEALDRLMEQLDRRTEAEREIIDAQIEGAQQRKEFEAEELERARERMAQLQEEREKEEEAIERQREAMSRVTQQVQGYGGAFMTVGNAITGVFDKIAASEEEGSEGAKRAARVRGAVMAAMAFVNSAIEYAAGLASIGEQNYVAAVSHFASGVAYDVAGALALTELGGSATRSSTGASTGQASITEPTEGGGAEREQRGAGITIYTMGANSARLAQEMRRADRELQRSALDSPMASGGGWS